MGQFYTTRQPTVAEAWAAYDAEHGMPRVISAEEMAHPLPLPAEEMARIAALLLG